MLFKLQGLLGAPYSSHLTPNSVYVMLWLLDTRHVRETHLVLRVDTVQNLDTSFSAQKHTMF